MNVKMFHRVYILICYCLVAAIICVLGGGVETKKLGIIGGNPTNIRKHPYQVTVMTDCSGVILNKRWILTLASCIIPYDSRISDFNIRAGANWHDKGGKLYKLQQAVIHRMYNMTTRMFDFCLLKTQEPIKFNKNVKRIGYATKPLKTGARGLVSGWGQHENKTQSYAFRDISLYLIDFLTCQKLYSGHVRDSMFCATSKNSNNGPCLWDWADPMVFRKKVYGLYAGWLIKCPSAEFPSVFNDVTSVADWIKETMRK